MAIAPPIQTAAPTQNTALTPVLSRNNQGAAYTVPGVRLIQRILGTETGGGFLLNQIEAQPGVSPGTHRHTREDETFIVLSGELEIAYGDERTLIGPGDIAFLPRGIEHNFTVHGSQPARFLSFVDGANFQEFFPKLAQAFGGGIPDMEMVHRAAAEHGMMYICHGDAPARTNTLAPVIYRSGGGTEYRVGAESMTFMLTGAQTGGRFLLTRCLAPAQAGPPPHMHTREDEFFCMISGELAVWIDGVDYVLTAGDAAFLPRNVPHRFEGRGEGAEFYMLATGTNFEAFFPRFADAMGDVPPDMDRVMAVFADHGILLR